MIHKSYKRFLYDPNHENKILPDMTKPKMLSSKCNSTDEPPSKKKKDAASPSFESSALPDEVALSCLARVSKLDYPALSLVSKRYRSIVSSPELFDLRLSIGHTEESIYVCLQTPPYPTPRWFILVRDTTRKNLDLVQVPTYSSLPWEASSVVVLDWGIYVIGGVVNGKPTSGVWLLDCRFHTWHHVPSMGVARASATAGVVDGKIYVFGGCHLKDYSNWGEVFNPKTQTWDTLSVPLPDDVDIIGFDSICNGRVMNAKIYGVPRWGSAIYYSPSEAKWGRGNCNLYGGNKRGWCVIDKVLYSCDYRGIIMWSEQEELEKTETMSILWKQVKGLDGLSKSLSRSRLVHYVWDDIVNMLDISTQLEELLPGAKLGNSGGNMVVFWEVLVGGLESLQIWCTEISLERRTGGHIWGTILSSNAVMTLDPLLYRFKILHSLPVKV